MDVNQMKQEILQKTAYQADDLVRIVEILRAPSGCPWDREQTHASIRNDLIEETYEVIEAIDNADPKLLREELGDVLLQIAMHAEMEREAGRFTFGDIANDICVKMIHRHPHVFGGTMQADTSEQVLVNWEVLKRKEKDQRSTADAIEAVPHTLPALWRAEKVQKKTAKVGFDWPDVWGAMDKLAEELTEVSDAIGGEGSIEEELGDSAVYLGKDAFFNLK